VLWREAREYLWAGLSWAQAFRPMSRAEVLPGRFAGRNPLKLPRQPTRQEHKRAIDVMSCHILSEIAAGASETNAISMLCGAA
jgi:hypothetical protein